ncbi:MAG TPA: cytochrome P450 [Archangium sp.]|nr:cytochrome P450 [Archangium sp.]
MARPCSPPRRSVTSPRGIPLAASASTNTHAMLFLSERPDVQEKLRADHRLIPAFIEELLRYEPSVHGLVRVTTAEVTLSGTTIPAGSLVLALLASANRDENRYSNPEAFVLERQQASVSFGHGIHSCIGSQLVRVEARLALEALLTRLKRFTRVPGESTWTMLPIRRAPVKLPFRFEA